LFTFGLVPLTLQQGLIRLAKFGLIAGLISATGWSFFSEYVVTFFNEGTDDLINAVSSIGAQGYVASEYEALQILDTVLESVFSIKNFIIMIALLSNPVVGTVLGLIYLAGFAFFILAIFKAVSVYLVALIARSILFGIAPVFFAFMLFQRTSFLFRGWLSQVIIFSLSPIFFFAFFSFYATMMTNAMNNMIGSVDLCWVQSVTWEGVPDGAMKSWKFCPAGATDPAECGKVKDINSADCSANITSCLAGIGEILPISNILTFLVIGYLAWRFGDLVVQIAGQIAQATQFMGRAGGLSGYFQGAFGTTGGRGGGGTTTGM
jgi:type IV secretory pathway VirB6-like protein